MIEAGLSLILSLSLAIPTGLPVPSEQPTLTPAREQTHVLEPLISAVLLSHPSQRSQGLLLESAKAGVDSAKWQFYPTPSVTVEQAGTSATDPSYQGDRAVTKLSLQQPLWTGGRLTAGLQKAQANASVTQATMEEVRQQLALRVVQSYGDWMGAYLKTLANEKSMSTHVRLQALVRRRISEGVAPDSDLTLAVSRLELLASDTMVGRAQQDIALARLGQLLGYSVTPAIFSSALAAPRQVNSGLSSLVAQSLAIYPGLLKARSLAEVQESVVAERHADLSPEVYVRLERQYGNLSYRNAPSENRLFVGLTSHFGAGLTNLSNIESAKSQYLAALEEIDAQGRIASEQVLADYALATAAQSRFDAVQTSLKAAEEVSKSYDRQFLAGRKTWLDVMNAARELAQTEAQLADIVSTQVIVTWRLAIYTQGLSAVLQAQP